SFSLRYCQLSKRQLSCYLHNTRVQRTGDYAKGVRTVEVDAGVAKPRVIERVEHFPTNIQFDIFANGEVTRDCHVDVPGTWSANAIPARVAEGTSGLALKSRCIKPFR